MHSLTTAGKGHLCGLLFAIVIEKKWEEALFWTSDVRLPYILSLSLFVFVSLLQRQATQKDGDRHFPIPTVP